MNIVYLIGNGFDLNLGMRTKYEHFYEYYLSHSRKEDSPHITKFKDTIAKDKKNWSDLELALGNYTSQVKENEAVMLHNHLIEHLSNYIASEEEKCSFNETQKEVFLNHLVFSHNKLLSVEIKALDNYRSKWKHYLWDVKIITFNYTRTIEKILGGAGINSNPLQIGRTSGYNINLSAIEHIHGFANERMILGVNDVSQIANVQLHGAMPVLNRYVKSFCNSVYGLEHDEKCQGWITPANLICLFGLSFGDTDKKWWEMIGETLKKDGKVILFEYNPNVQINPNRGVDLLEAKETVKDRFLSKTNLDEDLKIKVKKDIYVAYNTDMFKLGVSKNKN